MSQFWLVGRSERDVLGYNIALSEESLQSLSTEYFSDVASD